MTVPTLRSRISATLRHDCMPFRPDRALSPDMVCRDSEGASLHGWKCQTFRPSDLLNYLHSPFNSLLIHGDEMMVPVR
jgi:hypothetical protein